MLFRCSLLRISLRSSISYRWLSSQQRYTVKDVRIPVPFVKGHIAARLWESNTKEPESSVKVPPIICVNGWGDTVTAFEPLAPILVENRPGQSVLAFDLPGHGYSYHTPGPYSDLHMEGLLSLLRIVRHFSWDKVTMLGHSFGGLVALSFTASFPELVKNLIGIEMFHPLFINVEGENGLAFTRSSVEGLLDNERKMLNAGNRPPPSYTRQEMVQKMVKGREPQGGLTPEGCDMLIDRGAKKLDNGKYQFTHDPRNAQFFWLARMGFNHVVNMADAISCPMSVITCKQSWNPEDVPLCKHLISTLRSNCKPFEENQVSGTHHVHMLQPQVVAPIINQFLKDN